MKRPPQILETTLRDGSYVLDFQFTVADTYTLARTLDTLGFPYIEVGHGVGLGKYRETGAGATDLEYARAAQTVVQDGLWGMFCIPGIATLDDLQAAIDAGMGFVRVGTNAQDAEQARPYIAMAKKAGLWVAANYMKSYTLRPEQIARLAAKSADFGADIVYVVDSAGGMLPREVAAYVDAVRSAGVDAGFHGHDNLCLSVANSLVAMRHGAAVIDTSLQGLGRSAGNTPTEVFLMAMERMGYDHGYDLIDVMDAGEELVKPLVRRHGHDSLITTTGYALFHSSHMGTIRDYAGRYGVDPRRLIMAVCQHDRVNAPEPLVEQEAKRLAESGDRAYPARFGMHHYHGRAA